MTENILLLVTEVLLLGGITLFLHGISRRYGLAPLLIYLASLVAILHSMAALPVFVEAWGQRVLVSDVVVVPTILMTILILYEADGTAVARISILSILGVSLVVLGIQVIRRVHLAMPGGANPMGLHADNPLFARPWSITVASMMAFAAGLPAIAIIHQAVSNAVPRAARVLAPGLALQGALLVDDVVFRVLASGWKGYLSHFPAGILGRSAVGLLLWPLAAGYLVLARRRSHDFAGARKRGSLDLLFGSYGQRDEALRVTEASRRDTENRLQTVISHAPVVVFGVDVDGRFTLSEGAGLAALGLDPGEVVGQSAFDLFPDVADELRRALEGEGFTTLVEVGEHAYDVTYMPVREGGRVTGLTGVATDISMRRRAERALQEAEVRFRSTFEQAAVGLLHAEPSGRIALANRTMSDMLGCAEAEMFPRRLVDLVSPEDREDWENGIRRVLDGSEDPFETDCRYRHRKGGLVWAHTTVSAVRSPAGHTRYLIIVAEDLTERRATEEQLRQAQKMEAVGQLTGGLAHDFNNLLTVVIGGIEMTLDEPVGTPGGRGMLLDALRSAEKGAALTQQLLAFSRRQALRPTAIHVGELLQDMSRLLSRTLGETINVVLDVASDTGRCVADRGQMESAMLNLALNARDAMPRGGTLTLRARREHLDEQGAGDLELEPGRYVQVEVSDTGKGMSPEALDRAFDPFFTTKEVGKGSGLGLSMVYGFAKQSGGGIRLANEPGEGLTVRLLLPAAEEDTACGDREADTGRESAGDGSLVLLVEDEPGVRAVTTRMLESLGYRVVSADRAADALEILRSRDDVTLLLTDVVLPGRRNGPELAAEARERHPGLRVVLSSGYTGDSLPDMARLTAGVPLLEKPFRREELGRVLAAAMRAR